MRGIHKLALLLGAVAILGGNAKAQNTQPTRLSPMPFATSPARPGQPLPESTSRALGDSLGDLLKSVTREDVKMENARVFKEIGPGNISTSCGLAWVFGAPGFYIIQTNDDGLIYVSVRPSEDEIRIAGCLRERATWEYRTPR